MFVGSCMKDVMLLWIFYQYWKNNLMKWDLKDYGGVEEIYVFFEDVWVLDILLYNK